MELVVGQPVPSRLADAQVLDATGAMHSLGSAWSKSDALVLFVRQFACAGCDVHIADLRPRLEQLAALGVNVVVVGNGTTETLAAWIAEQRLADHPITLYTDPSLEAFRAAGLVRSLVASIGPRALWTIARLVAQGHPNGLPRGDMAQQGGTLFVRRGGQLGFVHRSQRLGDHAAVADVVQIVLAARASEAGGFEGIV